MSADLAFSLLELIALALPAIGIYMQILTRIQGIGEKSKLGVTRRESLNFALARQSLRSLIVSGVLLVAYLIAVQPPVLFPGREKVIHSVLAGSLYVSLVLLAYSLVLVGMAVELRTLSPMLISNEKWVIRQYVMHKYRTSREAAERVRRSGADFLRYDTVDKLQEDLRNLSQSPNKDKQSVGVDSEEQGERLVDRGWADSVSEEGEEYEVRLSELGQFIRRHYCEGWPYNPPNLNDPIYTSPKEYLEDLETEFYEREGGE